MCDPSDHPLGYQMLFKSCLWSRRVKTGLISVDIVSHWCWSSTILQSANQAWIYGVTGPYWYAGGTFLCSQRLNLCAQPNVSAKCKSGGWQAFVSCLCSPQVSLSAYKLHCHAAATLQIFFFGVIAVYIKVSLFANSLDKTSIDHRLPSPPAHRGS